MSFPPHMSMIPPMPFFPSGPPNMAVPPPGMPLTMNGIHKTAENEKKNRLQATTTVFVGSISDRAPDAMIKRMLLNCGSVVNWKRVQGANGKLQAFGFCEYETPEGTLRCIRLLNGWQIQDKNLVVKVDAKTKALLDEYKKKKRHELAKKAANDTTAFKFIYEDDDDDDDQTKKSNSADVDGKNKSGEEGEIQEEENDYLDSETRLEDSTIKRSLETIMREYSREMNQRALEAKEQAIREAQTETMAPMPQPTLPPDVPSTSNVRPIDPTAALEDGEEKRNLITNQIQLFRDRFKDEDTKMRNTEKERKDRYERERALQREKRAAEEAAAHEMSSRDRNREERSSSRGRTSNSIRSRTDDRRRSPAPSSRSYKSHENDEDDDEAYERKKQERRLREKEFRYRDRLKVWEQRERRKQNDYELEKRRELDRLHDEEKEGKRLLAFLDEYNDENDDPKYYKGTALARRLKDRDHEIEIDNRDRRQEKDEREELRQKLSLQKDIDDVEAEIKRRLEREEELIRKRLADLIRPACEESADEMDDDQKPTIPQSKSPHSETKLSPPQTSAIGDAPITATKIQSKRKLPVNDAFRDDQDDEQTNGLSKKSKLSAISDPSTVTKSENSPRLKEEPIQRTTPVKVAAITPTSNAHSAQVQEEKRQAVRKLIESIPTKKEDLFAFPLDYSLLDSNLMEKRIEPWVTKKIVEYIGEEEATLTEFICTSIMAKKSAETILSDIRVVLDDEAEVFVVKMWRLIVYEIEAKRYGINK